MGFKKQLKIRKLIWLIIITACIFYFILIFGETALYIGNEILSNSLNIFSAMFVFFLLLVVVFIGFFLRPILKKQEIHNQPSWIYYFYWGIIYGSLIWSLIAFLIERIKYWWIGLVISLLIIFLKWLNSRMTELPDLSFKNFASGAVCADNDKLNFKISAQNAAFGLKNLDDYVSVVGLYGGSGFGKSSYARMIVEFFDQRQTLYTYISLTETNEARDFSKLFAERWLETLAERYPKLDVTSYLPFMHSILRESGNGLFSDFLNILSALNQGLIKTKAVIFDRFYSTGQKPEFTSEKIGKVFGNIPEIEENIWVIMIDEIERSQFDEIYRLIEIVERFKNEGRSGLPVKLLFIFCISEPEFTEYLKTFESIDPRVHLVQTFFYADPKSINYRIFLPPIEPSLKQAYIIESLNKIIIKEEIDIPQKINPMTILDPSRSFIEKHDEALGYFVGLLTEHSPRVISRIATALDFFYGSFRDRTGGLQKNAIRFSDIAILEFIKIKYPYLIDFFLKTINTLVNQTEINSIETYFLKKEFEEKKFTLVEWIESVTSRKLNEKEKEEVLKLVGLVMHYYFDFLAKDFDIKDKIKYSGTTSYPEIMNDYLSLLSDSIETEYRKYSKIYQQHKIQENSNFLVNLDNNQLIGYARFLSDVHGSTQKIKLELITELYERYTTQKISFEPRNVGDTLYDEGLYRFVFLILSVIEKDNSTSNPSTELKLVLKILSDMLKSPALNIGAKYIILNSLANNERGQGSDIHLRLNAGFDKMINFFETEIKIIIKDVFTDAENRYFSNKQKLTIYENEENFFYTLYQSWSGSIEAEHEIESIRLAASRDLEKYPDAIKLYWRNFPKKDGGQTFNDVLAADPFFYKIASHNLYMPLSTLVNITKQAKIEDEEVKAKLVFWDGLMNDPKLREVFKLKDDPSTLKSVLIKRGLLELIDDNPLK